MAAFFLFWITQDRDAKRINKRLTALTDVLHVSPAQSQLNVLGNANRLKSYFAPNATISLLPLWPARIAPDDLAAIYMEVHRRVDRLDVTLSDRKLQLSDDRQRAVMHCTAHGTIHQGNQRNREIHEFRIEWARIDGEWYIQQAEIVRAIRAPTADSLD